MERIGIYEDGEREDGMDDGIKRVARELRTQRMTWCCVPYSFWFCFLEFYCA